MFEKLLRWLRLNLRYLGRPPWDTGISPPELKTFLASVEPGRALDVGCGTGTNLVTLARHGWEVVGVDFACLSVLRARVKLRKAGIEARVIHGDVTGSLKFSSPFDFILDIGCYHSLSPEGREGYRQNIKHWLKSGGTYLIYAHKRRAPKGKHGITSQDIEHFQSFMRLQWRTDSPERRPDGGGGRPSTWARFLREESM
mgnify:CR=1 FL=1